MENAVALRLGQVKAASRRVTADAGRWLHGRDHDALSGAKKGNGCPPALDEGIGVGSDDGPLGLLAPDDASKIERNQAAVVAA